jgi:hypothetical protein
MQDGCYDSMKGLDSRNLFRRAASLSVVAEILRKLY